jgi:hypothetical protein
MPWLASRAWISKPAIWMVSGVVVFAAGAALAWQWPFLLLAILYGAAPGLIVIFGVLMSQWLLHERYKRQLLFMPGFTRIKGGSSFIKANSTQRAADPSTIDAPQALARQSGGSDT